MTARFATNDEIETWDDLIVKNADGGEFFQTFEFGEIKQYGHWRPRHVVIDTTYILALEKSVIGLGKLWYIQRGPGLSSVKELVALLPALQSFAAQHGVFTVKFEPQLLASPEAKQRLIDAGLRPARQAQPTLSTIWLDLSESEEKILAGFSSKTRYNIRQAQKAGVECREVEATDENCRIFYNLFIETADGRFGIRPFAYYQQFWQQFCNTQHGKLLFAYLDDTVVSADFIMILGYKASRKDAASPRQKPVRGAAALLEYEATKILKAIDVEQYDLCGTPTAQNIKDTTDPLYGVGQFKAGFSDVVTDYIGTYELPISPLKYRVWQQFAERALIRLYRQRHTQFY